VSRNRPRAVDEEHLHAILARHCRLSGNGIPLRCAATREEKNNPELMVERRAYVDKVILIDHQHAEDCARELTALFGTPHRVYPCPRSKRGHYHLTTQAEYRPDG